MSPAWRKSDSDVKGRGRIFEWGFRVGTTVQADAKFLRRIFLGLVLLTLATGAMAGLATVQAMTGTPGACTSACD